MTTAIAPRLMGKRILVTGAGKGIGRVTVETLISEGAEVIAASRSAEDLANLAHQTGCRPHIVDLADADAARAAAEQALPLDGLVNNAGIAELAPFLETTAALFERIMAVNARAPMLISQVVARDWIRRKAAGAIVNVSSLASLWGTPDHAAYGASKAALDSLTMTMANELGPFGIRANSINPVVTLTPMAERAWSDPAKADTMLVRIPLRRFATPKEIASVISFLLSEEASMINGVILPIDGGFRAA
ncbi:MAG TPA: SDR family oxidoreductase [Acetobacteraceae bacterium]|nr:SDR family oxidoreductase [Acetobacteraceae bacterium]